MVTLPLYLDCHATTPVDPRVWAAMVPYFQEQFGNAASGSHGYGWQAQGAIAQARETIARTINAQAEEIVFTSGATEANNLAIKGVAEAHLQKGRHLVTVATEHQAVLGPCGYLEKLGFEVTYLPVDSQGLVCLETLEASVRPDTVLVSVMAANNEIGVLQPLAAIGEICQRHGVLFHSDGAQAIGKIPLDVEACHLDILSLTAHKIHGPKGIGALYVRRRPRFPLAAQIHGGGQENQYRPGTLPTAQIVGLSQAIALAHNLQREEQAHLKTLRTILWEHLRPLPGVTLNGHWEQRLAGNLHITVSGVSGGVLLKAINQVAAVSSGSACSSGQGKPSHVLLALGRPPREAAASLRFGLGRGHTKAQIEAIAPQICEIIAKVRHNGT